MYFVFSFIAVTSSELARLKDAFERSMPVAGYMSKNAFSQDVIGELVPEKLTEVKLNKK